MIEQLKTRWVEQVPRWWVWASVGIFVIHGIFDAATTVSVLSLTQILGIDFAALELNPMIPHHPLEIVALMYSVSLLVMFLAFELGFRVFTHGSNRDRIVYTVELGLILLVGIVVVCLNTISIFKLISLV